MFLRSIVIFFFLSSFLSIGYASAAEKPVIAVVVSLNIRPYFEALEGIRQTFEEEGSAETEIYYIEDYPQNNQETLVENLDAGDYRGIIAIGPEAMRLIWLRVSSHDGFRLYAMALNPDRIIDPMPDGFCGVSLNIPYTAQADMFSRIFPDAKRIGLIFDPIENSFAAARAIEAGEGKFNVIPLEILTRQDIGPVLAKNWGKMDSLWFIPDRTVISESVVKFIIREALSKNVAVFGFNRFFYESGAALAFVLDYRGIGIQTGQLAARLLKGGACDSPVPDFKTWINPRVIKALGMRENSDGMPGVEAGP